MVLITPGRSLALEDSKPWDYSHVLDSKDWMSMLRILWKKNGRKTNWNK